MYTLYVKDMEILTKISNFHIIDVFLYIHVYLILIFKIINVF